MALMLTTGQRVDEPGCHHRLWAQLFGLGKDGGGGGGGGELGVWGERIMALILTASQRVDEGGRGRWLRALLLGLRHLGVALGELESQRLGKVRVKPNALL